jgi:hypothetical protein
MFSFAVFSAQAHEAHEGLHHWEIPSQDPDRIILTFCGDPATSRAVTWRTDASVTQAVAEIAEATVTPSFTEHVVSKDATTEPFDLGQYKSNHSLIVHYHSVVFENLKPDTLYVYRVGDGHEFWSEWIQFRTAKDGYAPMQFVYFGDAQVDVLAHWSRVMRMAYQTAPHAAFAIHAGDIINVAHRDYEWAQWFKAGGFLHSLWTVIPVVGNHEFQPFEKGEAKRLSIQWRPQFTLPVEQDLPTELHETVYAVDYQDVRIIVLNSNDRLEEQTEYIKRKLESSQAKWNIITAHHSVFSPARGRNLKYLRVEWKKILDKYHVDLVLNGHDHFYTRGHVPVRTADGEDTEDLGTVYITSVSGSKFYELDREKLAAQSAQGYRSDKIAEQTQFFQTITIEDDTLTYVAYTALGEEYDRAIIQKDFKTGRKQLFQDGK